MNDNPKKETRGKNPELKCLDGKETCEDCRMTEFDKVKSVHFTLCQKPWVCPFFSLKKGLCKDFLRSWYEIRKDFQEKNGIPINANIDEVNFHNDVFQGFCSGSGQRNYKKIQI